MIKLIFENELNFFYAKALIFPDQWFIAISVERDEVAFNWKNFLMLLLKSVDTINLTE